MRALAWFTRRLAARRRCDLRHCRLLLGLRCERRPIHEAPGHRRSPNSLKGKILAAYQV